MLDEPPGWQASSKLPEHANRPEPRAQSAEYVCAPGASVMDAERRSLAVEFSAERAGYPYDVFFGWNSLRQRSSRGGGVRSRRPNLGAHQSSGR
jgi:hypothetical protein